MLVFKTVERSQRYIFSGSVSGEGCKKYSECFPLLHALVRVEETDSGRVVQGERGVRGHTGNIQCLIVGTSDCFLLQKTSASLPQLAMKL